VVIDDKETAIFNALPQNDSTVEDLLSIDNDSVVETHQNLNNDEEQKQTTKILKVLIWNILIVHSMN